MFEVDNHFSDNHYIASYKSVLIFTLDDKLELEFHVLKCFLWMN